MTKRKMFFHMITASLLRRRSRMVIALLAITVGAAILSGLVTIYYDVPRQMGAQFRNYGANMILTPTEESFTSEDLNRAVDQIADNELVGATPFTYMSIRIHSQPIQAVGTDIESVQKTSPYWLVDGDWPSESYEILVGEEVATALNISVGDKISLTYTPESEYDENGEEIIVLDTIIDFTVTGTVNTGGSEEEYVYISEEDMAELCGVSDSYDVAEISISTNSEGLNNYVQAISDNVPGVKASLVKRVTASETTVLNKLQGLVLLVTIIVLALTMICVATTMTAVVSERRSEIGLRKAIGASDKSIFAEFMGEGMLLGMLGGILGSLVGFAFAQFVSVNVFGSYISFRPLLIPITIVASIVVTGAACLFPIRSAISIEPALVLKGE